MEMDAVGGRSLRRWSYKTVLFLHAWGCAPPPLLLSSLYWVLYVGCNLFQCCIECCMLVVIFFSVFLSYILCDLGCPSPDWLHQELFANYLLLDEICVEARSRKKITLFAWSDKDDVPHNSVHDLHMAQPHMLITNCKDNHFGLKTNIVLEKKWNSWKVLDQ
jgi:hypothetical protein